MFDPLDCFENIQFNLDKLDNFDYVKKNLNCDAPMSPFCVYLLCLTMLLHEVHFSGGTEFKECSVLKTLGFFGQFSKNHFMLTDYGQQFVNRYLPHYRFIVIVQTCAIEFKRLFWILLMILCGIFMSRIPFWCLKSSNILFVYISIITLGLALVSIVAPLYIIVMCANVVDSHPLNINLPFAKMPKRCLVAFLYDHNMLHDVHNSLLQTLIDYNIFASKRALAVFKLKFNWLALRMGFMLWFDELVLW